MGKSDALIPNNGASFAKDSEELRNHIHINVLDGVASTSGNTTVSSRVISRESRRESRHKAYEVLLSGYGVDRDDFVSPLSCEAYVEQRLMPRLAWFEKKAPKVKAMLVFH